MKGRPLEFLLLLFAGWVNRRQRDVIDYLKLENRILREHLQGRRLQFTDDQRRRLAVRGQALGRRLLRDVTSLLTPDTILRWYRQLIAAKYDGSSRRGPGRPPTARSIQELVLKFARENPSWGYTRRCSLRAPLRDAGDVHDNWLHADDLSGRYIGVRSSATENSWVRESSSSRRVLSARWR